MNIVEILERQALSCGSQMAIADRRRSLSFAELNDEAACAALDLLDAGVRPRDRVLVFCPMSVDLYVTLIAIFRIGAVAVFVDPSAGRRQIAACCRRLEPRGFVASPKAHLLRLISREIRRVPIKLAVGGRVPMTAAVAWWRPQGRSEPQPIEPCSPFSPALITFTTGSTGQPKAAVRTHGHLLEQHRVLARELDLQPGQVDIVTLPVFVLANLASGVTSIIPDVDLRKPREVDGSALARQIAAAGACRMTASPSLMARLTDHLLAAGGRADLRHIFTGGGPVLPSLMDALAETAPAAAITAIYGSTEAEPIARLNHHDLSPSDRATMRDGGGLPAGMPVASIDIRIIPDEWGRALGPYEPTEFTSLALPASQPGEIVVAGPHVLPGYLDGIGDTETKIRVGDRVWHRTGDAGYVDSGGRLWLLGRCSARVSDERGTMYPFAVECAAAALEGIRRTAFVRHRGRRVLLAEFQARARPSARDDLRRQLAWASLDEVVIVDRIPMDARHNAKVDYSRLHRFRVPGSEFTVREKGSRLRGSWFAGRTTEP